MTNVRKSSNLVKSHELINYFIILQGCIHRGDRCAPKFADTLTLSPPGGGGRFCPPLQRSHPNFPYGYIPEIHIFFKISTARQCLFLTFVRFMNWTLIVKLFLFWFSRWYNTGVIFRFTNKFTTLTKHENNQTNWNITLENLKKI